MEGKEQVKTEKLEGKLKIDEKDRAIVNYLNKNSRATLKEIGKEVGLSIDAVKDRIDKLKKNGVIDRFTIMINPSKLGFPVASHVYIRLQNITEVRYKELIDYLKFHDRIPILISMMGDFDLYMLMISENNSNMSKTMMDIRQKFSELIAEWKEVTTAQVYKIEEYRF
ncbi:MAG: winged helix-turn-helix transcriptional regulator [Candidatus Aenigmarchaeota archaeon]|nr:winged helix-turn-helix transcriptional regulator [Candidatus Aenigmarchaeota archaeon]